MSVVDVAIVGGGISGLSTAWYVQTKAPELTYTILERGDRWGGKIRTDVVDAPDLGEFVVEGGPDAFITQKPWGMQLARELGLGDDLLPTNDAKRQVFVLNKGKPTPMPDGVLLIVPTKFTPFALSPLISPWGKLRMGMDLFIPAKRDGEDETLAEFITRRLGTEALDKIAEPLMSGIYNAEAEKQSVLATFPRFRTMEEQHGSLIKGMLASRRAHAAPAKPAAAADGASTNGAAPKPRTSAFMSLRGGMNELINGLVAQLTGDMRLETGVNALERDDAGNYQLQLSDGTTLTARTVVMATPAHVASTLLAPLAPAASTALDEIRYVSTGTLSFAFRLGDVPNLLTGFGLVIPRSEGRAINAVTINSIKFDHRAPEGAVLLRAFFGGSRRPDMMEIDDATLLQTVRGELASILGIEAEPLFYRIYRWMQANPQYDVGHMARVEAVEAALPDGLFVTGSPYRGVGIPDCVHQGQQTAAALIARLQATPDVAAETSAAG